MASGIHDLEWFTRESLMRGLGKPQIRKAMLDAGWTEDQVRNAVDAYSDVTFPVPIPRPRPQLSARDAFLYLVLFTTLYAPITSAACYLISSTKRSPIRRSLPTKPDGIACAGPRRP
jgi:hypothetical protein